MDDRIESLSDDVFKEQFADSPQLLAFWEAHFAGPENAVARHRLLEVSDSGSFSLRPWVDSLHTLQAWLDAGACGWALKERWNRGANSLDARGSEQLEKKFV